MDRRRPTALLLAAAVACLPAASSAPRPTPDHAIELELGESASVAGAPVAGANAGHLGGTDGGYPCGEDPAATCRSVLVTVTNPFGDDATKGRERATLDLVLTGEGAGDAALKVHEATADGERGAPVGGADELGSGADESTAVVVVTTADEEVRHYLVEVFFHAWVGTWDLEASFA